MSCRVAQAARFDAMTSVPGCTISRAVAKPGNAVSNYSDVATDGPAGCGAQGSNHHHP
jgi:hypothetical protein